MYISQIDRQNFGSNKVLTKAAKRIDRSLLQKETGNKFYDKYLSHGDGDKYSEAKHVVIGMTMTNTFIGAAAAQIPVGDMAALSAVEVAMGLKIINDIYGFKFNQAFKDSIMMSAKASVVGVLASKAFTWIPVIGNIANAAIAGYTTKAFGDALVEKCEKIRKEIERGKKIDEILKGL